jgi:hypothetical protein
MRVREGVLDADAVVLLNGVKQLVGLRVQAAGVQAAMVRETAVWKSQPVLRFSHKSPADDIR